MPTPDIELIISAQNKELLKELADTKKRVLALGKEFDKSDKGNYTKTKKGLQGISDQLARTKKQAAGLFVVWQAGGRAIKGFGRNIRGLGSDLLTNVRSFETLRIQLKQLQGSTQGGFEAFKFVKDFAKNTPLQLEGVTKAFVRLKALGLDPMDGTMQSLVDINAKMGGSQERLEGIILGVGQAWTKGRLQAEEANQLIERGIPVWDILTKVTGKAGEELQDMSRKGLLGRDAIRALIDEMGRTSQGAAIEQIATLNGQISNLQDNWSQFLDLIGESGAKDYFLAQITAINKAITEMSESGDLERYAQEISNSIISMAESLKTGAVFIYDNAEALKALAKVAAGLGALKVGAIVLGWSKNTATATANSIKHQTALAKETRAQTTKTAATVKDSQVILANAKIAEKAAFSASIKAQADLKAAHAQLLATSKSGAYTTALGNEYKASRAAAAAKLGYVATTNATTIANTRATAAINLQSVTTVGAMGKMKGLAKSFFSLNNAMAIFIGYEIGTWLRNEFEIVEKAGIALAAGVHKVVLAVISKFKELAVVAEFVLSAPIDAAKVALLDYVSALSSIVKNFGPVGIAADLAFKKLTKNIKPGTKAADEYRKKIIEIREELEKNKKVVDAGYLRQFAKVGVKPANPTKKDEESKDVTGKKQPIDIDLDVGIGKKSAEKAANDAERLEKDIQSKLLQARIDTLKNEGKIVEARSLELQRQYGELLTNLKTKGDVAGIDLIDGLINTELTQAKLQQLESQFNATLLELRAKEQSIVNQQASGALSESQATQEMLILRRDQSALMDELILKTQALYDVTADPRVLEALNGMKGKIKETAAELDKFEQGAKQAAENSLADFFDDIFSGTKSAKAAFSDMASSFARSVARMVAEALAADIIKKLLGSGGSAGGTGDFFSSIMGFFKHTGGMVGGATISRKMSPLVFAGAPRLHDGGLLKNDEVPTILQKGEEVLSKNDPRNVTNGGDSAGGTRIINVIDPNMVEDYMRSSSGEKVIMNFIQRNPNAIKQVLT